VTEARPSLREYAASHPAHHGNRAWFRDLPQDVQDEVVTNWMAGVPGRVIVDWLRDCGFTDVTRNKVDLFLRSHHPRTIE